MVELLDPNMKELKDVFDHEFQGMTRRSVTLEELVSVREELVELICGTLTDDERRFILSIKEGQPKWELLGLEGIQNLRAVQWKLQNIGRMTSAKRKKATDKLRRYLNL